MASAKEKAEKMKEAIAEEVAKAQALISSLELNMDDYDLGVGLEDLQAIVADLTEKQEAANKLKADAAAGNAKDPKEGDDSEDKETDSDGKVSEAPKAQSFAEMAKNTRDAYRKSYFNGQAVPSKPKAEEKAE